MPFCFLGYDFSICYPCVKLRCHCCSFVLCTMVLCSFVSPHFRSSATMLHVLFFVFLQVRVQQESVSIWGFASSSSAKRDVWFFDLKKFLRGASKNIRIRFLFSFQLLLCVTYSFLIVYSFNDESDVSFGINTRSC